MHFICADVPVCARRSDCASTPFSHRTPYMLMSNILCPNLNFVKPAHVVNVQVEVAAIAR